MHDELFINHSHVNGCNQSIVLQNIYAEIHSTWVSLMRPNGKNLYKTCDLEKNYLMYCNLFINRKLNTIKN